MIAVCQTVHNNTTCTASAFVLIVFLFEKASWATQHARSIQRASAGLTIVVVVVCANHRSRAGLQIVAGGHRGGIGAGAHVA